MSVFYILLLLKQKCLKNFFPKVTNAFKKHYIEASFNHKEVFATLLIFQKIYNNLALLTYPIDVHLPLTYCLKFV